MTTPYHPSDYARSKGGVTVEAQRGRVKRERAKREAARKEAKRAKAERAHFARLVPSRLLAVAPPKGFVQNPRGRLLLPVDLALGRRSATRSRRGHSHGSREPSTQAGGGGGGSALAEPIYGGGWLNETLHLEETWANQSAGAWSAAPNRSDGSGNGWTAAGANSYGTVVATPDGFGSEKYVELDYDSDPPILVHGTGDHAAGDHWYLPGSNDDDAYFVVSTVTSSDSTTLTDSTKSWTTNQLVGCYVLQNNAQISSGAILSNTGTTITVAGWTGSPPTGTYQVSNNNRSSRGFIAETNEYLNDTAYKASMVYEWAVEEAGTNWFEGKAFDINGGTSAGYARYNYGPFDAKLGWGGSGVSTALRALYYSTLTGSGDERNALGLSLDSPPHYSYLAPVINHDNNEAGAPASTVVYKQNMNWGASAGQYAMGDGNKYSGTVANADGSGTSKKLWEAGWLYHKLRITKQTPGAGYGYGRIEMWIGKTPGSLIKVMEYLGGSGQREEGLVYVDPDETNAASDPLFRTKVYELASRQFYGACTTRIGLVRIWSHDRLEI